MEKGGEESAAAAVAMPTTRCATTTAYTEYCVGGIGGPCLQFVHWRVPATIADEGDGSTLGELIPTSLKLDVNIDRPVLVVVNGKAYVIGGSVITPSRTMVTVPDMYSFTRTSTEVTVAPPLPAKRTGHFAGVHDDRYITVIGGSDGSVWQNSIYRFDAADDTWTTLEPAPFCVASVQGAISMGDYLYVLGGSYQGGWTFSTPQSENTEFMCYNLRTGEWQMLPGYAKDDEVDSVQGGGIGYSPEEPERQCIYAVIGVPDMCQSYLTRYDIEKSEWTRLSDLPTDVTSKIKIYATQDKRKLIVMTPNVPLLQVYDIYTDAWQQFAFPKPLDLKVFYQSIYTQW